MGNKSVHIMSMDYIPTGRAFNRLMEETFHEKQIEVIVTHDIDTPQNAYSEGYIDTTPHTLWYPGPLDSIFLCDDRHY